MLTQLLETRQKALLRFALDFLKANREDLEAEGMFDAFNPAPSEEEIDKLKETLGVQFS